MIDNSESYDYNSYLWIMRIVIMNIFNQIATGKCETPVQVSTLQRKGEWSRVELLQKS